MIGCGVAEEWEPSAPASCHFNVVVQSLPNGDGSKWQDRSPEGLDEKFAPIVMDCFFAGLPVDQPAVVDWLYAFYLACTEKYNWQR